MNLDWEKDIYCKGLQYNKWPYTEVISEVKRLYPFEMLRGLSIAEIGCGTGNNLLFFASEGCRVSGLDYSATALMVARDLLAENELEASLVAGDVTQPLPWKSESYDIVIDRGCLTHVSHKDLKSLLNEIHRILKPGGHFFSFTLFGSNSSDLQHGVEIFPNTFSHFKAGYFSKIGMTSVFDGDIIKSLWESFGIIKWSEYVLTNQLNGTKLTTYSVVAEKDEQSDL
jgi:SAM-dependent methyltransferase